MVKCENITVRYRISTDRINSIKEYVVQMLKGKLGYREFQALTNVSFAISKGEVLGILGHNGAGNGFRSVSPAAEAPYCNWQRDGASAE